MSPLTHAIEDYLKVIYQISRACQRASTSQIAAALEVTPASVSGMLRKLASTDPPLVVYHKHRGVTLTPQGERIAIEIVRHHRLLETFLHQILGYDWDEVHAEADRLEHVISEAFEERIAQVLGNPTHDPHGDPIPTRDLEVPSHSETRLSDLRPPQRAIIARVSDSDPALLRYLQEYGLLPQTLITITRYTNFDENIALQANGCEETIVLGPRASQQIFVELLPS